MLINFMLLPVIYIFILTLSLPRPVKTGHFIILLCLTPDNITC